MKLIVDKQILEKFPSLTLGVIICKNLDNHGVSEEIQNKLREIETEIKLKYSSEKLSQEIKIDIWRKAYSSFGAKPKDNKSSVENLYSLVLKGMNLRHINKLVDLYNLISLKHMVPIGGEDINKVQGDVFLTFAEANEPHVLLLGDKESRPPHKGEVIYKDNISAICRRWNWREADRTKFTEETKNCFIVLEGLSPVTRQEIEKAAKELGDLVKKVCGGDVTYNYLSKDKSEIEF